MPGVVLTWNTSWYRRPAVTPPKMGPTQYTQWFSQQPTTTLGPRLRAGFMLDPVRGMANRWQVVMDSPMARGAEPFTLPALLASAAAAKTTRTSTMVIMNSIPNA